MPGFGPQLVTDGGFEGWIEDLSTTWTDGAAAIAPLRDAPYSGSASARLYTADGACIQQSLDLGVGGVGERYAVAAAVRLDEAGPSAARLELRARFEDGAVADRGVDLEAIDDGQWYETETVLVFEDPPAALTVAVCGAAAGSSVYGLDEVSVRVSP